MKKKLFRRLSSLLQLQAEGGHDGENSENVSIILSEKNIYLEF